MGLRLLAVLSWLFGMLIDYWRLSFKTMIAIVSDSDLNLAIICSRALEKVLLCGFLFPKFSDFYLSAVAHARILIFHFKKNGKCHIFVTLHSFTTQNDMKSCKKTTIRLVKGIS